MRVILILISPCDQVDININREDDKWQKLSTKWHFIPGEVPQQRLRSSICSTSRPINQEPRETSSFTYLWSMCLQMKMLLSNSFTEHSISENKTLWSKGLPIHWNIGGQIFGYCINLSSSMPKILISLLTEFPVFRLMILHPSAYVDVMNYMHKLIIRNSSQEDFAIILLCQDWSRLHTADVNARFWPMAG